MQSVTVSKMFYPRFVFFRIHTLTWNEIIIINKISGQQKRNQKLWWVFCWVLSPTCADLYEKSLRITTGIKLGCAWGPATTPCSWGLLLSRANAALISCFLLLQVVVSIDCAVVVFHTSPPIVGQQQPNAAGDRGKQEKEVYSCMLAFRKRHKGLAKRGEETWAGKTEIQPTIKAVLLNFNVSIKRHKKKARSLLLNTTMPTVGGRKTLKLGKGLFSSPDSLQQLPDGCQRFILKCHL